VQFIDINPAAAGTRREIRLLDLPKVDVNGERAGPGVERVWAADWPNRAHDPHPRIARQLQPCFIEDLPGRGGECPGLGDRTVAGAPLRRSPSLLALWRATISARRGGSSVTTRGSSASGGKATNIPSPVSSRWHRSQLTPHSRIASRSTSYIPLWMASW
jgi:hypothetical protein